MENNLYLPLGLMTVWVIFTIGLTNTVIGVLWSFAYIITFFIIQIQNHAHRGKSQ